MTNLCYLKVGRLLIWAGLYDHMGGPGALGRHTLIRDGKGKPLLVDEMGHEDKAVSFNISHQVIPEATPLHDT